MVSIIQEKKTKLCYLALSAGILFIICIAMQQIKKINKILGKVNNK